MGFSQHIKNAFTLIETMISMTVISVGIMAVISSISTLNSSRQFTSDNMRINALLRTLEDRTQGALWADLATSRLPWSQARLYEDHTGSSPDLPAMTQADLLTMGIISQPVVQDNNALKLYFEYYRAVTLKDESGNLIVGKEGLLDDASLTSVVASKGIYKSALNRAKYRINPLFSGTGLEDTSLVGENDPVLIRMVLILDDVRVFEIVTGRKR